MRGYIRFISVLLAGGLLLSLGGCGTSDTALVSTDAVRGRVLYDGKPVVLATVRVQGTSKSVLTGRKGEFTLSGLEPGREVTVSAWKDGFYCEKVEGVRPPARGVRLEMRRYQTTDNSDYEWMPPVGEESCFDCKPVLTASWLEHSAHADAAENHRFLTMYNGTDVHGNASPPRRYKHSKDYGSVPLPFGKGEEYFGPGYRLDFPGSSGNCAACHLPGAAVDAPLSTDPNDAHGADAYGIHCDFCHKVAAVELNPKTGLPPTNRPGIMSLDVRRPFPEDEERFQLFFGTFDDDNVPEEDTYLPLLEDSAFCAPCHFGVFWDTVVYNSYGEWLESTYSDPITGLTCQECHMPAPTVYKGEVMTNVAPGAGGIERDPETIHSHFALGTRHIDFMRDALSMTVEAVPEPRAETGTVPRRRVTVRVELVNDNTGHSIPTDSPLRHLILLVEAFDGAGRPLELAEGEVLPAWCGVPGSFPTDKRIKGVGAHAGKPGKTFAKILEDRWTGEVPTGGYWNPTSVAADTRLDPFEPDISRFIFSVDTNSAGSGSMGYGDDEVRIRVRLLYRRGYYDLMHFKGWDDADLVLRDEIVEIGLR